MIFKKIKQFFGMERTDYFVAVVVLLLFSFMTGLSSVFWRVPSSWYDEHVHYARVMVLSRDIMAPATGAKISENEQKLIDQSMTSVAASLEVKQPQVISQDWPENFKALTYTDELVKTKDASAATIYTAYVYAPYLFMAWIGHAAEWDVTTTLIAMRLAGFVLSFILLIFAIRKAAVAKLFIAMIAAIPTISISMSAITADNLTNMLIMLFIAVTTSIYARLVSNEEIYSNQIFNYFTLSILVCLTKIPAFMVLALYIPLIIKMFQRKQNRVLSYTFLGLLLFCAFISLTWYLSISGLNANVSYYHRSDNIDMAKQLTFITEHFGKTAGIFFANFLDYPFATLQFGYADTGKLMTVPNMIALSSFIAILVSVFVKDRTPKLENRNFSLYNGVARMIFALVVILIFAIFYLQNSEVGSMTIAGIQSRYFFPFLTLLMPLSANSIKYSWKGMTTLAVIAAAPSIYYLVTIWGQL